VRELRREPGALDVTLGELVKGTVFAGRVHRFASIDSTNSALLEDAASQPPLSEGTVYLADEQTAGRGRGGHSWHSPAGVGLYLSVLLRPHLQPDGLLGITLAAGMAAAQAIEQVAKVTCDLRWPNDLLIGSKKAGGILAEMNSGNGSAFVVGFGINVNHPSLPAELEESATSLLLATGKRVDAVALAAALLQFFDRECRQLTREGLRPLLERFARHSSYVRGKRVLVGENGGYEGTTDGLDERGFLRVKTADGIRTVISGCVRAVET
jgi:BirA family biotin operon repressor/biotin-[acetyl-CoA-carboxylase] ligase